MAEHPIYVLLKPLMEFSGPMVSTPIQPVAPCSQALVYKPIISTTQNFLVNLSNASGNLIAVSMLPSMHPFMFYSSRTWLMRCFLQRMVVPENSRILVEFPSVGKLLLICMQGSVKGKMVVMLE